MLERNRADRHEVTADWVIAEMARTYEQALKSENYTPAIKALHLLGQEVGLFRERREVTHQHNHSVETLLLQAESGALEGDYEVVDGVAEPVPPASGEDP